MLASGGTAGGGAHPAPGEGPSGGWETAVRREPEGGVVILWPGASELLLWWAGHPDRIAPLWVLVAAGVWRLISLCPVLVQGPSLIPRVMLSVRKERVRGWCRERA